MTPRSAPITRRSAQSSSACAACASRRTPGTSTACRPHLRMTFRVEDERGALVAEGNDLDALREQVRPRLREALATAAAPLEHHGLTAWTLGDAAEGRRAARHRAGRARLPGARRRGRDGRRARAGDARRPSARRCGRGRASCSPSTCRRRSATCRARLSNADQLALAGAPHGSPRAVLEDATVAALDALTAEAGGPAWDAEGFARAARARRRRARRPDRGGRRRRRADPRRRSGGRARARRRSRGGAALAQAREDVAAPARPARVPRLRHGRPGAARLPDVERYLRARRRRLERLPNAPAPDLDRMRGIHELEAELRAPARGGPAGPPGAGRAARGRRGCSRSCASATSRRRSARAARSPPSGSASCSTRRADRRGGLGISPMPRSPARP